MLKFKLHVHEATEAFVANCINKNYGFFLRFRNLASRRKMRFVDIGKGIFCLFLE